MNKRMFEKIMETRTNEILNDFEVLENGTIIVDAKKITKLNIESILNFNPKRVIFTKKVECFDTLAFKNADCLAFDFSTATNLKEIKCKCFKNAYNVIWSSQLDKAQSSQNAFENIRIIATIDDNKTIQQ